MAFLETPRFPDDISYNGIGGPQFQTEIAELDSGYEYANQNWSLARARYEIGHDARVSSQFQTLLAFYVAVKGRANAFRYKDWADFAATSSQGVFAMLTSTTFQMYKRYTSGANTYDRKIQKPIATATITGGTTPVVDYTTGIVTVASGTPTAWAGEFDVPVRFDTDVMQASIIARSGTTMVHGWSSIVLLEVRL